MPETPPLEGQDARDWSPSEAFRRAAEIADKGDPSDGLAIMLWRNDGYYRTSLTCSGLSSSEIVALLDVIKSRVLLDLNGITPPDDE